MRIRVRDPMTLSDLLLPQAILPRARASTRPALFALLATRAEETMGLSCAAVLAATLAREDVGTTGFGGGVALPHARLAELARPVGLFARLATPLAWNAVDGAPVDLVFLLLSPPPGSAEHLKALARVSRCFRDRGLVARLRGAADADAIHALLAGEPLARAA